ncbi:OmpA family protein [Falsihalocynthiibacter sp. SS001]|uniref:OmpA family protein n=1 Tax=Falsihalocynthiibacter sp. SS001 TaxID=3349698 RepID=UPI0036D2B51D
MKRFAQVLGILFALSFAPNHANAQEFGVINFDFDSTELDAVARQQIVEIAAKLNASTSYKPSIVVGYTDAVGTSGYNYDLGRRRAEAVRAALLAAGATVDRIGTIESRGENELLIPVSVPERQNRRVTVKLDDILAACPSYRNITLSRNAIGAELQNDLVAKLDRAVSVYNSYTKNGLNSSAYQMAGAAREDCGEAVGYSDGSVRKLEYAKKCFCNSARLDVAMGKVLPN